MSAVIHNACAAVASLAMIAVINVITVVGTAHASDIACEAPATRASQIICETALFSMGYQRIHTDQQRLLKSGVITQADVDAFRRQRDACTSASCLDAVFSAWRQHLADIGASQAPRGRQTK